MSGEPKRTGRTITYDGLTLTYGAWAQRTGISRHTIETRIEDGWTAEEALTTQVRDWGAHAREPRYADDPEAQRIVAERGGEVSLDEVGAFFGVSRERARQIENSALRSIGQRLRLAGISEDDVAEWLRRKAEVGHPLDGRHGQEEWSYTTVATETPSEVTARERAENERCDAQSEDGLRLERAIAALEIFAEAAERASRGGGGT